MVKLFFIPLSVILLLLPFFTSAAMCPNLYRNLSFGSRGSDVVALQNFLIAQGDLSAGNNTGYFGRLTESAVKTWQAKNGLVSSGTAATTGYGAVGPRTRAKIASVCGGGTISANFSASPLAGPAPLTVLFSIRNLPTPLMPDSGTWFSVDFGNGTQEYLDSWHTDQTQQHTYSKIGTYTAKLIRTSNPCAKVMNCNVKTSVDIVGTVTITVTSGTVSNLSCTSDSHCPSSHYTCEAIRSTGTVCAYTANGKVDPNCVETTTILEGACKLKEGRSCLTSAQCIAGTLCHAGICTNPIGKVCNGASEASSETLCGVGWQCWTSPCGPPVMSQNDPPPVYHCALNEYVTQQETRGYMCPQCLAATTLIDTPIGKMPVKDLHSGMPVWTTDAALNRISGIITATSKVSVSNHTVVHLTLDDGRSVFVSAGHPTVDGRTVGDLKVGDVYDGATIVSAKRVPYTEGATYDLLPSGETGFYFADGILLGSTLSH